VTKLRHFAAAVAVSALMAGGTSACSRTLKATTWPAVPTTLQLRQASSTTIGPDFSNTPLPVATGPNAPEAKLRIGAGRVTMTGIVQGPDGPVGGAVVRVERLVDNELASIDVTANDQGVYRLDRIQAGRVRIRAFRPPDLIALEPIVTFAAGTFQQELKVKRFDQTSIQWSLAPSEPKVNQPANIVVQVSRQTVGTDGVLRQLPVPAVGVTVTPLGLLQTDLIQELLTNERGRVQILLRCLGIGDSDLQIALATGESAKISPPACREVPVTTTTLATIPPTKAPAPVTNAVPVVTVPVVPVTPVETVPVSPVDPLAPTTAVPAATPVVVVPVPVPATVPPAPVSVSVP
jgi:hypothetical protein